MALPQFLLTPTTAEVRVVAADLLNEYPFTK